MKKKLHLSLFLVCFTKFVFAQDFHLSQYESNPLYLNPALTGSNVNEDWKYRITGNYREQGSKYIGAYHSTFASGFDISLTDRFSIGEFLINNKAMNNAYNTFNFMLSGAYKISNRNPHHLSVGVQMGLLHKSINANNFVYDSQYSEAADDGFDEMLPSGENFSTENFFNFDANVGFYYRFNERDERYSPYVGFSVYHLTQPNGSFIGDISKTSMRFVLHGGCYYSISEEFYILPQLLYMNQAKASELNLGVLGFYKIPNTDYEPMIGCSWRNKDAMIFHGGLKLNANIFRIGYDMTTSSLKNYNNGRGALELSVIYTIKKRSN